MIFIKITDFKLNSNHLYFVDRIQWFHKNAGTSVEEMEAAAVAQVAKGYNTPYLSIRTISNSEVSGGRIEELKTAGQYCGEFAVEM